MKKQVNLSRSVLILALATVLLLLVPFVAMQYTVEVDWSVGDFVIMGTLIFGCGFSFLSFTKSAPNIVYRIAAAMALGATFLMIWANLAVGLIGSGPNAGNLMYGGVLLVVIIGTLFSRLNAVGMERTMYAASLALTLLAGIALWTGMQQYPGSSVREILAVNGFFAGIYLVAGALFRYAARTTVARQA